METAPGTAVAVASEAIAAEPAPGTPPVVIADEAPEVTELREAQAAEALAEAARKAGVTTAPVVEGTPATAPAAAAPAAGQPVTMVPVGAVMKERTMRQEAERKLAIAEGAAHAYRTVAEGRTAAPVVEQPPAKSADERLAEITKARIDAAEQFDNNKLTAKQLEEKRVELEAQERAIRDEQRPKPVAAAPVVVQDDLALAQHATELVKNHPVLRLTTEAQLLPLQDLVYEQARAAGETPPTGVLETTWLRERVAKLAETIYPTLAAEAKKLVTTAAPVAAAAPASVAPLSPIATARDAKLNLAAEHPADVSKLGSPASVAGQTDAEVEARLAVATEDEAIAILASMPALHARLLGSAAK